MKLKIYLLTVIIFASCALSQGITMDIPIPQVSPTDQILFPLIQEEQISYSNPSQRPHSFTLLDSIQIEVLIPPQSYVAVFVDVASENLSYTPSESPLDSSMQFWVDTAPEDMRRQLQVNLKALDPIQYPVYDDMLRSADPLWWDELLYCIAHLAHEILELPEMPYLLIENVQKIYEYDSLLSYVDIVDIGTPGTADHRTEAHYVTRDTGMTVFDTVVLESEMYYKYVMFPKITDEIPGFIEPHTGDRIDPWYGCFWRTWFWSIEERIDTMEYWSLGDSLQMVSALWNGLFNDLTDNGAVGVVSAWVQHSLEFTSDSERPHQPVRIYAKHKGRCGEHEDLTVAAARTALLPVRGIESISTDHVWNEFWTGWRWASLEPFHPYVDNQWVYIGPGWSKKFATVYEHTGKGRMVPVTDRYSHEIATINITATDAVGKPVDGAKVMIAAENGTSIYYDCILFTNSRGQVQTIVGNEKHMYYRVDSEIGYNPEPGYVTNLVDHTVDGANYTRSISVPGTLPNLSYAIDTITDTPTAYLGARIKPLCEFTEYVAPFDDITSTYFHRTDDAYGFSLFALTDDQFARFEAGSSFVARNMVDCCGSAGMETSVSNESYWVVLSNSKNINTTLAGELSVMLHGSPTIADESELPEEMKLSAHPNPFNSAVTIALGGVGDGSPVPFDVEIYDVNGRMVDRGTVGAYCIRPFDGSTRLTPTTQEYIWSPHESLPSGVYLVRARVGGRGDLAPTGQAATKRIVYLK
jgi:hypothetical protein